MRGAVVAILAAVLALPAAASTSFGPPSRALRVVDFTPVVVRGSGFQMKERVRVVLQVKGKRAKTVVADTTGTFTARFVGISLRSCSGYLVRATGNKGSRAYLRRLNECPAE